MREEFVEAARDLAQAVQLLDAWLSRGGSLPSDWKAAR